MLVCCTCLENKTGSSGKGSIPLASAMNTSLLPPWHGKPSPTLQEEALRFLEGEVIQKVEHETQFFDSKPVFRLHLANGRTLRFHAIAWDQGDK